MISGAAITPAMRGGCSIVLLFSFAMMVGEIAAGQFYGSMALLADGWHMATHLAALGISLLAYRFAERQADE